MDMQIVTNKGVGSKVYFLKQIKKEICPICNGGGKIMLSKPIKPDFDCATSFVDSLVGQVVNVLAGNMAQYTCPECNGKGKIKIHGQPKYELGEGTVKSVNMIANEQETTFVYSVDDSCCVRSLSEAKLYVDREVAEKQCYFMNLERRCVPH